MSAVKSPKATWDIQLTEHFIRACLVQVGNERQGTSFTKKGWIAIVKQFHEESGKNYDRTQLKNRYDNLRKEWRIWYKIYGKESGVGWDNVKHNFDASDEWWENKIMVCNETSEIL